MTHEAVLDLVDNAPAFVDVDPATLAQAERKFGNEQMGAALARLKATEGDDRLPALSATAELLGALAAAGAIAEPLAKASLEAAVVDIGLIRDIGAKAVKSAIAAGLKLGKKTPADLTEVRRAASAALGAPHINGRPPVAGDDAIFPADQPPPPEAASSSSFPAAPAPPVGGNEDPTSQMGDWPEATASAGGAGSREPDVDPTVLHRRLAFFPLTDLGNAERFRERQRGKLLFLTALATTSPGRQRGWLAWDKKRWSSESGAERVMIAEHETVRAIQDEADCVADSGRRDVGDAEPGACDFAVEVKRDDTVVLYSEKIAKWGRTSESAQKLGALSKRGAPYFSVGIGQIDADPMKINVNNGTLVVRKRDDGDYVQFRPHDPADMITKVSPVDYDPSAEAPEFHKFLLRVQPDPDTRLFLQQWFGLSLTGDTSAHKLTFLYGKGRNGKSVLVNAVSYVAGDYAQSVPIETFLDAGKSRSGGQATPDLAKLPGVRLLRTSEPEKNAKLAEALIKLVTGGEPMDARHLQGDMFTFLPEFKLTIQGNYKPLLSGTDEGIKSRLLLVPFSVTIPKEERDMQLANKLKAEASGILNWMLDGLRSWLDKGGLTEPKEVTDATAKYFATSDVLGRFLENCTVKEPGHRVQSSVLHQVYEAWCKSSGETPWKNRGFSLAMDERGYERKQSDVVWWLDIKLIKSVNDFVDAQGNPIRVSGSGDNGESAGDDEI
ncbi:phage/plasmid primase, P4 family [Bradyrhizobium sp. I71]|uniref:DNA primase family protein n=1 Tax=Bradyrhizobium sp. I71 TaxID=2590772 RepID=UPI001EF7E7AD|nr:phage/plasmid primase, P4 family [Bradyrhizobium sp. I71]ULK98861.1 DNA primase [Bradyrhizobium sp. I71]